MSPNLDNDLLTSRAGVEFAGIASTIESTTSVSDDHQGCRRAVTYEHIDHKITVALGMELKHAREAAGLSQAQVVDRMPSALHVKTFASYEQGARPCTVVRLCEIGRALGVSATDLLERALLHAEIDLQTGWIHVDVHALSRDTTPELQPLRRWASARLVTYPTTTLVRLPGDVLQEMAVMVGSTMTELVSHLARFAPNPETGNWGGTLNGVSRRT